jgi:flagellar basal body-associated protein FliL
MENNNSSGANTVLIVIVIIILVAGGMWYFLRGRDNSEADRSIDVQVDLDGSNSQ